MNLCFINPPVNVSVNQKIKQAETLCNLFSERMNKEQSKETDNRWEIWINMHKDMSENMKPENLSIFQSHPSIAPQITGGSGHHYLKMIGDYYGQSSLDFFLKNHTESMCGKPKDIVCIDGHYISITSMRHLFHTARIKNNCDFLYNKPITFVEIGGGFGNLSRMILQYNLCSKYYIIDHPVLHAIQAFYLQDFFHLENIAIVEGKDQYLTGSKESKIQLCSLFDYEWILDDIQNPYVLVSTMALTEIPPKGQYNYMRKLSPDLVYIFGQFENACLGGGKSAKNQSFDNKPLIYDFGVRFHTLDYNFFGYHFEYIGRKITFYDNSIK